MNEGTTGLMQHSYTVQFAIANHFQNTGHSGVFTTATSSNKTGKEASFKPLCIANI